MKNMASYQTSFIQDIRIIIETGRTNAIKSVDLCRVKMYWNIGKRIFEEEQQGKERADYGTYLLANLAKALEPEYGSGFQKGSWNGHGNFTDCIQLRLHCGRN